MSVAEEAPHKTESELRHELESHAADLEAEKRRTLQAIEALTPEPPRRKPGRPRKSETTP